MTSSEFTGRPATDGGPSTITPDHNPAVPRAVAVHLEKLRQRLLDEAMPLVEVTGKALDYASELSERTLLERALKIMDEVAGELNEVSGINGPIEDDEEGQPS